MTTLIHITSQVAAAFWQTLGEMAPWLLFGFAAAGLLSVWVTKQMVERHLGGPGPGPVIKAAVVGVPLPLCSCGVLPFAGSMYRRGASRGATSSFLLSTPQTGVDAFFATWALMGPVFAVVRPAVAFVHGVLGGLAVNTIAGARPPATPPASPAAEKASREGEAPAEPRVAEGKASCCGSTPEDAPPASCCGAGTPEIQGTRPDGSNSLFSEQKRESNPEALGCCGSTTAPAPPTLRARVADAARFAFVTLPGDLAGSLLIGVFIAAALMALVPPDALTPYLGGGLLSMLAAVVVGTPLYLCATGSIPVALGLIAVGASPGAALAFLIAGPATNAATLAVTWKLMGARTGLTYLASVVIVAVAAGLALDATFTVASLGLPAAALHAHEHAAPWWQHVAAAVLLGLLVWPVYKRARRVTTATGEASRRRAAEVSSQGAPAA